MENSYDSLAEQELQDQSVSDWVDSRELDASTHGEQGSATSKEDLRAIRNCFNILQRVWPTEIAPQSMAGPFTLEQEIGRGGMGRVWEGLQHEPVSRKVAVKLINPGPQTEQMIRRFESERNILAMMNHPGIATLIDAGETEQGQLYFAMEFVDGPDLIEYCNQKCLSTNERLTLFLDACAAVQHAHQKGIVHRDLKPSNILVGQVDGQPLLKVIDFGLSKAESGSPKLDLEAKHASSQAVNTKTTLDGQVIGSVRYMSPEQAAGDLANIDIRSDIYSLGIVFYKLLTDSIPLDSKLVDKAHIQRALDMIQLDSDPPSKCLSELADDKLAQLADNRQTSTKAYLSVLQSDLDWIAMRAIKKHPSARYETVAQFAADVRRFLNNEPVAARPDSRIYKLRKELSRNRLLWSSVAAIIFTLVSGIVVAGMGFSSANKAKNLAEKRLEHSRRSNEILTDIFSDLNLEDIEMTTTPFRVVVGRRLITTAKGLDAGSIGDPAEVARLQLKLADALIGLEFFKEAIPISREAFDVARTIESDDQFKYRAGIALVKALRGAAELSEATETLTPLLIECQEDQGKDGESYLELLLLKGMVAAANFEPDDARHCFEEVASRREKLWGNSDLRTLDAKYWLAFFHLEPGSVDTGLPLYEEVTEKYRKLLPKGHPKTIKAILDQAWMISNAGGDSRTRSFELANEGFALAKETYGNDHVMTYEAKMTLGLVSHRAGNEYEGTQLLEEAWVGLSKTAGLSHPRANSARMFLADVSYRNGDVRRAIELLKGAKSTGNSQFRIQMMLAGFYTDVGEYEKARNLLWLTLAETNDSIWNSYFFYEIGRSYHEEGNHLAAIEAIQNSLEVALKSEDKYHFPVMRKTLMLARCFCENGDHDKATEIIERYVETMPESFESDNLIRLCCDAELGMVFRRAGKTEAAYAQFSKVLFSGKILLHQDLLIRELRLTQIEMGDTERLDEGIERQLNTFIRKRFSPNSIQRAIRLRKLGHDLIDYKMPVKARDVLAESMVIFEEQKPDSWQLQMTKFEIASLELEIEPPESEAGQMASLDLEEAWLQLDTMRAEAFPIEVRKLENSVAHVAKTYGSESDVASQQLWLDRLESLKE